jgi:hypothetical protein
MMSEQSISGGILKLVSQISVIDNKYTEAYSPQEYDISNNKIKDVFGTNSDIYKSMSIYIKITKSENYIMDPYVVLERFSINGYTNVNHDSEIISDKETLQKYLFYHKSNLKSIVYFNLTGNGLYVYESILKQKLVSCYESKDTYTIIINLPIYKLLSYFSTLQASDLITDFVITFNKIYNYESCKIEHRVLFCDSIYRTSLLDNNFGLSFTNTNLILCTSQTDIMIDTESLNIEYVTDNLVYGIFIVFSEKPNNDFNIEVLLNNITILNNNIMVYKNYLEQYFPNMNNTKYMVYIPFADHNDPKSMTLCSHRIDKLIIKLSGNEASNKMSFIELSKNVLIHDTYANYVQKCGGALSGQLRTLEVLPGRTGLPHLVNKKIYLSCFNESHFKTDQSNIKIEDIIDTNIKITL